jgi:hypothetical protein
MDGAEKKNENILANIGLEWEYSNTVFMTTSWSRWEGFVINILFAFYYYLFVEMVD